MDDRIVFNEDTHSDEIRYANETHSQLMPENGKDWKILIVDDEEEIHNVTKMVLSDVVFKGRKLMFFHAYNSDDTKRIMVQHPDTALILLDVVMEEDDTGLRIIRYIRDELKNILVRIVIRTGQPGEAPEKKVIMDYDINDYKEKAELTSQKLFSTVIASLRSYENLITLDKNRKGLEKIIDASAQFFEMQQIRKFCFEVLTQLKALFNIHMDREENALSGFVAARERSSFSVISSIGRYEHAAQADILSPGVLAKINRLTGEKKYVSFEKTTYIGLLKSKINIDYIIYIEVPESFTESDTYLINILFSNISNIFENIQLTNELEDTQKEILNTLGEVVESRHHETGFHVKKVSEYSYLLARKYGLGDEESLLVRQAAPMHDVGKVGILDSILNKPAKLTPEEFEIIKTHTTIGYNIFRNSKRSILQAAAIIALQHHEKYDGTGYPQGLKGEGIHIYGRILCLTDVFDALGSERVYKPAWPMEKILAYIKQESGKSFDPGLVKIFFDNITEIIRIRDSSNIEEKLNRGIPV